MLVRPIGCPSSGTHTNFHVNNHMEETLHVDPLCMLTSVGDTNYINSVI